MYELSFSFIMDLYRAKIKAKKRNDQAAIQSLKQHYPELFGDEFTDFIENVKFVAMILDQKYEQNFSEIFKVEELIEIKSLLH